VSALQTLEYNGVNFKEEAKIDYETPYINRKPSIDIIIKQV